MPFYFRKSVSAGPFRFNFSSGGVGVSVGVRGLRIGTGPRGHYIHAGSNGFYYRASLGGASGQSRLRRGSTAPTAPPTPVEPTTAPVDLVEIDSANILALQDESFSDLLNELNEKAQQARLAVIVPTVLASAGLGATFIFGPQGAWLAVAALPGWLAGRWFDSYKRTSVLFYDLDGDRQGRYSKLTDAFDQIASCGGKWHIQASGALTDMMTRKRNAGATSLVRRKNLALNYTLPEIVKCNVTPPAIQADRQTLFFLPDVVLVKDGNRFGAIRYPDLRLAHQQSRFIEDGRVPFDAHVVDHTWQYTNKRGGPDRRFNNNRQLPVCLYDTLHFSSSSGLNELFEVSRLGVADTLAAALDDMRVIAPVSKPSTTAAEQPLRPTPSEPRPESEPLSERRGYIGKAVMAIAVVAGVVALVGAFREGRQRATGPAPTPVATASPAQRAAPSTAPARPVDKPPAVTPAPAAPAPTAPAAPPRDDRPLTTVEVRELQERLKALGFDPGDVDGIPGSQTAAAIRRFETSASLPIQGNMDRVTLQRVREAKPPR